MVGEAIESHLLTPQSVPEPGTLWLFGLIVASPAVAPRPAAAAGTGLTRRSRHMPNRLKSKTD